MLLLRSSEQNATAMEWMDRLAVLDIEESERHDQHL